MNDFEQNLERGLHELFDPYLAEQPRPWRTRPRAGVSGRVAGGLGGALVAKLATGAVIAALAAGAGVGVATTHSLNPVDWGRAASRQVQKAQPQVASTPVAHPVAPASPNRQTPAATPVAVSPAVSPPAVPSSLPTVNPIPLPTVKPTILPTIP